MCDVHENFPPSENDEDDHISFKKLLKHEGSWDIIKEILGFVFNSCDKTIRLTECKRDALMVTLKIWLQAFKKFEVCYTFQ
jgi:hypothetical protein